MPARKRSPANSSDPLGEALAWAVLSARRTHCRPRCTKFLARNQDSSARLRSAREAVADLDYQSAVEERNRMQRDRDRIHAPRSISHATSVAIVFIFLTTWSTCRKLVWRRRTVHVARAVRRLSWGPSRAYPHGGRRWRGPRCMSCWRIGCRSAVSATPCTACGSIRLHGTRPTCDWQASRPGNHRSSRWIRAILGRQTLVASDRWRWWSGAGSRSTGGAQRRERDGLLQAPDQPRGRTRPGWRSEIGSAHYANTMGIAFF